MTMREVRDVVAQKADLRRVMRDRLRAMSADHRRHKSTSASLNLIETREFREAGTVMVYLSLAYEVDTTQIIQEAWRQRKAVAVPKMLWERQRMLSVRLESLTDPFSEEVPGLRNPLSEDLLPGAEIEMVVVPALALDPWGNRLGRGGGHYDRFLAGLGPASRRCGLAFEEQMVDRIPTIETDQALHMTVTDAATRYSTASR